MKNKKVLFLFSFTLAAVLVGGTMSFSSISEANTDSGMMSMMNGDGMMKMMDAMNTPEGQEMIESCSNFMSSYSEKEEL